MCIRDSYLLVTNDNKGDWTQNTNADSFYERIYSNPGDYCVGVMEQWEKLNSCYIDSDKMKIIKSELCYKNIRLLFDDGG